jgi:hypothetical protein
MPTLRFDTVLVLLAGASAFAACDKKDEAPVTPTIAASAIAPPPAPVSPSALHYVLDPAAKTSIDMPAPKERIKGDTTAAAGEITVVPNDLAKTTGQVKIDLTTLTTHTFDDASKDKAQTEHAHNWLEAGDLVSSEVKEANRWVIFTIRSIDGLTEHDLSKVPTVHAGDDDGRTVAATAKGDFFLHGHQVPKDVAVEVVFHYPTGQAATAEPTRLEIRTKTPLRVTLAEHDVKPRDGLGKLAQASFSLLGTKVAETADVSFDVSATPTTPKPAKP